MLVLTERVNDRIEIDGPATVVVVSIQRGRVQLGFEADRSTTIVRQNAKVRERKPKERGDADHRTIVD